MMRDRPTGVFLHAEQPPDGPPHELREADERPQEQRHGQTGREREKVARTVLKHEMHAGSLRGFNGH